MIRKIAVAKRWKTISENATLDSGPLAGQACTISIAEPVTVIVEFDEPGDSGTENAAEGFPPLQKDER